MKWNKKDAGASVKDIFLHNMGVSSLDDVNALFQKSYDGLYTITGMDKAVCLTSKHISEHNKIRIMGDFDTDGICSVSILLSGLKAVNGIVSYDIPSRSEGFGVSKDMVDKAHDDGVSLIITCDNGIAQLDAINYARRYGMEVIIIDHHLPSADGLPEANVIIDLNAISGQAEFNGYCGAGLCYKFISELLADAFENRVIYKTLLNELLCFAAIATIADVMDLVEENYVFVKNGLKKLSFQTFLTTGLSELLSATGLDHIDITAKDIAFKLAPVINAQERMFDGGAKFAVDVLTYNGPVSDIRPNVEKMVNINQKRKDIKAEQERLCEQYIMDNCLYGDIPMVIRLDTCPPGIAGIIAGYACEQYHVPCIVLVPKTDSILTGSARSCGNYHLIDELNSVSSLLIHYGGHDAAAGLSLFKKNFDSFCEHIINDSSTDFEYDSPDEVNYNLEISEDDIPQVTKELIRYEPWGQGNPAPTFKVKNYRAIPIQGKYAKKSVNGNAVKLVGKGSEAVGFREIIDKLIDDSPRQLDIVGSLSINNYGGVPKCQIEIIDYQPVIQPGVKTSLAAKLSSMASS